VVLGHAPGRALRQRLEPAGLEQLGKALEGLKQLEKLKDLEKLATLFPKK